MRHKATGFLAAAGVSGTAGEGEEVTDTWGCQQRTGFVSLNYCRVQGLVSQNCPVQSLVSVNYCLVQGFVSPNYCRVQDFVSPNYCRIQSLVSPNYCRVQGLVSPNYCRVQGLVSPNYCRVQGFVSPNGRVQVTADGQRKVLYIPSVRATNSGCSTVMYVLH